MVLHGGFTSPIAVVGDTWEWDGKKWEDKTPKAPALNPAPRGVAVFGFLPRAGQAGQMVLFGGGLPDATSPGHPIATFQDTWTWDGTAWTELHPPAPIPSVRMSGAMAYHAGLDRLVMFGGFSGGAQQDTWEWDGATTWLNLTARPGGPSTRAAAALAYDPVRARTVLFGGSSNLTIATPSLRGDTWSWDGLNWRQDASTGVSARAGAAMAWDPVGKSVLLFGGSNDSAGTQFPAGTRSWNGTAWSAVAGSAPTPRWLHSMATCGGQLLLFGGLIGPMLDAPAPFPPSVELNDTWTWNGAAWLPTATAHQPGKRSMAGLACDGARGALVFGGSIGNLERDGETWTLRAGDWTRQGAVPSPSMRTGVAIAGHEARQTAVLFGGWNEPLAADTWEWDGAAWTELHPFNPQSLGLPQPRLWHSMAYDSLRDRVVMFGGQTASAYQDTWELDFGADERPGQTFAVDFDAAGMPPGSTVVSVAPKFVSGGHGQDAGTETDGVSLLAWLSTGWRSLGTNAAPATAPGALGAPLAAGELGPIQFGGTLNFAVQPLGTNGQGLATVATDYAEVRVRYRTP